jgi:hypothetical protein
MTVGQRRFVTNQIPKAVPMNLLLISNRILSTLTLAFVLLTTGVTTVTAASDVDVPATKVMAMSSEQPWYMHPNKSGDSRKGVYGAFTHSTGAVIPLTYPIEKAWYMHPNKSGDSRKGVYGMTAQSSGAVIPLTYPTEKAWYMHPNKSGDSRKGFYNVEAINSGAIIPLIQR